MKFAIQKVDIVDVLSKVQGLAGRKSNLASTANVLIRAGEAEISIAATDLETGFEGFYPAKVESEAHRARVVRRGSAAGLAIATSSNATAASRSAATAWTMTATA